MRLYKRLLSFLNPYTPQLIGVSICTIIVAGTTMLIAPLAGSIFKSIEDKNMLWLNLSALAMIGLFVIKGLFAYGQEYLSGFIVQRVMVNLRTRLYDHLQDLSLDFYGKWHTGELISRLMTDTSNLQVTLSTAFTTLIPHSVLLIGLLIYIFWLNWRLSLLTLIALPLIIHVIRIFGAEIREISEGVQQKTADLTTHLQETISQIKIVKSFTMEEKESEKFREKAERSFHLTMRALQILATQNPVVAFLQTVAIVAIMWYGGIEIVNGHLTLPQLVSFATALGIMTDPGNTLSRAFTIIQQGMASTKRIFEVEDQQPSIQDKNGAVNLPSISGKVEFQNLSFAYETEEILSNINLTVNPGEIIALVGKTGAGKSTLMSLLMRFYDPTSGRILVDGCDIRDVKIDSLRKQIAVVPQEITLFSGTIKDNIAYGNLNADEAEIIRAAKLANADPFIRELPHNYMTEVGERGAKLSGGERQRIAIARAILRDPRILILDEATSSLDPETEALIREALERLMQNRTCFVIAHRLYTVEKASRIAVIDDGKIAEIGTHRELLAKGGIYQRLYEIQFKNKA